MQTDLLAFNGRQINGISCGFNVKIKLNAAEKLEIHLENKQSYETYSCIIKTEDIKKENNRIHCDLIESCSELFQYFESLLKQSLFEEIIKVESRGKVSIKLEIQMTLNKGIKRKTFIYQFQTAKQSLNAIEKLRLQMNTFINDKQKFQKQIQKRMDDLQQENRNLKKQIQENYRGRQDQIEIIRFATYRNSLIIKNEIILQTANKLNIVLIGNNLTPQIPYEWKIRVCTKMILIFGIGSSQLTQLQNKALDEEIQRQKLLTKDYLNEGDIVTCTYQQGELKYIIQRVDIEQEQGDSPEPTYNMRRGSFMCKKLIRLDLMFPCFGLYFGGRIQILSNGIKKS